MKITFYSNFLNHHQIPFSDELYRELGLDYRFIAMRRVPNERLKLGYQSPSVKDYPYLIDVGNNPDLYEEAVKLSLESDVCLFGSASLGMLRIRMKSNKLSFRVSERKFKQWWRIFDLRVIYECLRYKRKNLQLLSIGSMSAKDMLLIGAYKNKMYERGYFPKIEEMIIETKENDIVSLLWVGRFLTWKRADWIIRAVSKLKEKNIDFKLTLIGEGPEKNNCINLISQYNLEESVTILVAVPSYEVQKYMSISDIYVFPSSRMEGWGAVVNEAMGNSCAVVGSSEAGAVNVLIKNKHNGLIFDGNDESDFYVKLEKCVLDYEMRKNISENARNTICDYWNCKVASERFLSLSRALINNEKSDIYANGVCKKL